MVTEQVRKYSSTEVENIIIQSLAIFHEKGIDAVSPGKINAVTGIDGAIIRETSKKLANEDKVVNFFKGSTPSKKLGKNVNLSEHALPNDFSFQGEFEGILEGKQNKVTVSQDAKKEASKKPVSKPTTKKVAVSNATTSTFSNPILKSIRDIFKKELSEGNATSLDTFVFTETFEHIDGISNDEIEKGLISLSKAGFLREDDALADEFFNNIYLIVGDKSNDLISMPESEFGKYFNLEPTSSVEMTRESTATKPVAANVEPKTESVNLERSDDAVEIDEPKAASESGVSQEKLEFASAVMRLTPKNLDDMKNVHKNEIGAYFLQFWMINEGGEAYNKGVLGKLLNTRMATSQPTLNKFLENGCKMGVLKEVVVGKRIKYAPVPLSEISITNVSLQGLNEAYADFDIDEQLASKLLDFEPSDAVTATSEEASVDNAPVKEAEITEDATIVENTQVQEETSESNSDSSTDASGKVSESEVSEELVSDDVSRDKKSSAVNEDSSLAAMPVLAQLDSLMDKINKSSQSGSSIDSSDIASAIAQIQQGVKVMSNENKMWRDSFESLVGNVQGHFDS